MSDPVDYLMAMDAAACRDCSTRKALEQKLATDRPELDSVFALTEKLQAAEQEIKILYKRRDDLLNVNNRFEEGYRDERCKRIAVEAFVTSIHAINLRFIPDDGISSADAWTEVVQLLARYSSADKAAR